jgi:uncharacterized protein YegP (UPF0339 family)
MNRPHFEVFPEMIRGSDHCQGEPTGQFCWHFKDANGRITFTGGEAFTRREDAHRSIEGVRRDVGVCGVCVKSSATRPPIIDLDENGKVIA